jgi:hypothetical protein
VRALVSLNLVRAQPLTLLPTKESASSITGITLRSLWLKTMSANPQRNAVPACQKVGVTFLPFVPINTVDV